MQGLTEVATTDTARTTVSYQKTGDLLTLPYTETSFITQPYATRVENVQTYLIQEWVGKITLDPVLVMSGLNKKKFLVI